MVITLTGIVKAFVLGSAGLAAWAWLTKQLVSFWLTRNVEAFKARLQASADNEMERLRTSLRMVALEHEVVFSKLHEKRAEVIADMYKNLVLIFFEGERFVIQGFNPTTQRQEYETVMQKINEFVLRFETNQIYLTSHVCSLMNTYVEKVRRAVIAVGVYGDATAAHILQEKSDALMKAYLNFERDIPAARRALETEFRNLLGVQDVAPAAADQKKRPSGTAS